MSPEHLRGMAVDARTDLFALGVVLHEMVTGQLPFRGATTSDLIVSILNSEPARLGQYLQNVPEELEGIVSKALRKIRDQRYQTAQEMLIDLLAVREKVGADVPGRSVPGAGGSEPVPVGEEIPGQSTPPQNDRDAGHSPGRLRQRKGAALAAVVLAIIATAIAYFVQVKIEVESIAVAPFAGVDRDPQAQQIADGISENLVNELSRFSEFKVKSREAVAPYKERDPQTIGRELDVKAVLTGRVLRTGHNVSVVVELIDPRDNTQIWGEIYHRMNSDPTALQEEVSRLIIEEIQARLSNGSWRLRVLVVSAQEQSHH
jgi:eukaryotic-like serine/threonine-protein kinase